MTSHVVHVDPTDAHRIHRGGRLSIGVACVACAWNHRAEVPSFRTSAVVLAERRMTHLHNETRHRP